MRPAAAATIQAAALHHNLQKVREAAPGARVLAVVKANAYGHGLVTVAAWLAGAADGLAVARLDEGLQLREAGIAGRIVVLGGCSAPDELAEALRHGLDVVVHSPEQVALLERSESRCDVWLKLDSGMGRLGIEPEALPQLLPRLQSRPAGGTLRLMTHMAAADADDPAPTASQLAAFARALMGWQGEFSIANSAAILRRRIAPALPSRFQAGASWVRPGLMLYGASPLAECPAAALGLQPAMSFESRLIAVKRLPRGHRVGYGGDWRAERDSVVGVAAVGYGDGYPWHSSRDTPVLVNGCRVPVIGRVSMDMISIDLTDAATAAPGDPVLLWGEGLPVEEVAQRAGTIAWQLLTGIGARVTRRFVP